MGILFFNWYGYQLLSSWLQDRADRRLEASLDINAFDQSQLISVKVPVTTLSYYNNTTGFERVDGQIEIGGVRYKYVSRRIYKDSLEYRCIPDQAATRLRSATNEFFRQVNDLQQHSSSGKKAPGAIYKGFAKEYCSTQYTPLTSGLRQETVIKRSQADAEKLPSRYAPTSEDPPDREQDSTLS
jgi:hypothetical protein